MSLNYQDTADECPGCGASESERRRGKPGEAQGLSECPWCGAEKCCMCDMGDDIECMSCDTAES